MSAAGRYGLNALLLALALAAAVRAVPVAQKQPIGRDIAEYASIARNLHSGAGYRLDIKAYHAVPTPVAHYSGYDRAPLFPFVLCLLEYVGPDDWAARLMGPLAFLLTLAFLFDLLRKFLPPGGAFGVTALLGLHPGLYELSMMPLTEPLVLLFLVITFWAVFRLENPWVAGFGAALAFLTRPSSALAAAAPALACLAPSMRRRRPWGFAAFAATALVGPALLIWLNRLYGAPALTLPQSFLFRVLDYAHVVHVRHEGGLHESPAALLRENLPAVLNRIARNALYYAQSLSAADRGVGALVLAAPAALWAVRGRRMAPAAVAALSAAVLDLGFYTLSWSTFDARRFTAVFVLAVSAVLLAGGWMALDALRPAPSDRRRVGAPGLAFLALALFWGASDAYSGYVAWREEAEGGPFRNLEETLWRREDSMEWRGWAGSDESLRAAAGGSMVSNVPWLAYDVTGLPSVLIPWDLTVDEARDFLQTFDARFVLVHRADWPERYGAGRAALERVLGEGGWKRRFARDEVEFWERMEAGEGSPQ